MKTHAKFAILVSGILGALVWLAMGSINESKSYYKTISELATMDEEAKARRLRVAGDVEANSIQREGAKVRFVLVQGHHRLPVIYMGKDPLPDTFRDGAQAVADGRLAADGTFHASRIQAKCASKYEAKPTSAPAVNSRRAAL